MFERNFKNLSIAYLRLGAVTGAVRERVSQQIMTENHLEDEKGGLAHSKEK
jgi:hypothetical protein